MVVQKWEERKRKEQEGYVKNNVQTVPKFDEKALIYNSMKLNEVHKE